MANDLEIKLTERMKPHPETQELGCWASRDELLRLFEERDQGDEEAMEEVALLAHECDQQAEKIEDLENAVSEALDHLTGDDIDSDAARATLVAVA